MNEGTRLRLLLLQVLVVSLFVTLGARLYYLQVLEAQQYQSSAESNRLRDVITPAARGDLLDQQGRQLVRNRTALVVRVDNGLLSKRKDKGRSVLEALSAVVDLPVGELQQRITPCTAKTPKPCWNGSPYQPVPVRDYPSDDPDSARRVQLISERSEDFPGVSVSLDPVRYYPMGQLGAQLLGYTAPVTDDEVKASKADGGDLRATDTIGRAGLESQYDAELRGQSGVRQVAVDQAGRVVDTVRNDLPVPGNNVVTTIDAGAQAAVEQALLDGVQRVRSTVDDRVTKQPFEVDGAAAVVLEAKTGRVVAAASYPTYDPSIWVGGIGEQDYARLTNDDGGNPALSRVTQGIGPPGSTFKPFSAATLLRNGDLAPGATYDCPGTYTVPETKATYKNFDSEVLGKVDVVKALQKSCDTIFYSIAYDNWVRDGGLRKTAATQALPDRELLVNGAKDWGFGRKTGIDLPTESSGQVLDRAGKVELWKALKDGPNGYCAAKDNQLYAELCTDGGDYRAGDAIFFPVGQGDTTVTPLQLATAYTALANGGTLFAPRLVKAVLAPDGTLVRDVPPQVNGTVPESPETLAYLRSALATVTRPGGTAGDAFAGFPLEQIPVAGKTGTAEVGPNISDTAWFAAMAPANDPEYVVVVQMTKAGQGGKSAAPVARDILSALFGVGRPAVLPAGAVGLPRILPDGRITTPGAADAPAVPPIPAGPQNPGSPGYATLVSLPDPGSAPSSAAGATGAPPGTAPPPSPDPPAAPGASATTSASGRSGSGPTRRAGP